ncbi:MAG TPA: winged helix-turn-helix domain-containing protein, partial [Dehalococcoidia bacterium]|nr:winged helix-turn-helix domain-containing protein [Dehalococcoidia bacterium]
TRLAGPRRIRGVNLIIDLAREEATNNDGARIPLTPSEYRLLAALAVQPGHVVDFGQLGAALPGHFRDADDAYNSVKVHVGRLRQKLLRTTGWDGHLVSVRGRGFLFERRLPRAGESSASESVPQRAAS